jgi:predicted nucleotidyltransferase
MKRTSKQVLKAIRENADGIRRFGVRRIGLFGSCVRDEATPASDLDFVVDLERHTFDDYMGLKEFLEDLFGCSVDLVMVETIKPALRSAILGEAVYAEGL